MLRLKRTNSTGPKILPKNYCWQTPVNWGFKALLALSTDNRLYRDDCTRSLEWHLTIEERTLDQELTASSRSGEPSDVDVSTCDASTTFGDDDISVDNVSSIVLLVSRSRHRKVSKGHQSDKELGRKLSHIFWDSLKDSFQFQRRQLHGGTETKTQIWADFFCFGRTVNRSFFATGTEVSGFWANRGKAEKHAMPRNEQIRSHTSTNNGTSSNELFDKTAKVQSCNC